MSLRPQHVNFEDKWKNLSVTITKVLQLVAIKSDTWTDCFGEVYSLCVAYPDSLANKLYDEIKSLLTHHVNDVYNLVNVSDEGSLLTTYFHHWNQFSRGAKCLDNLFQYLNLQHIQKQRYTEADQRYGHIILDMNDQHMEIGELAFEIWKEELINRIQQRLVSVLLACIKADRRGESLVAAVTTVHSVIQSLVDVCAFKKKNIYQLYETIFEDSLLNETRDFYRAESVTALQELPLSQYMKKVLIRKQEEKLRCTLFLPPSGHQKVEKAVHGELVEKHLAAIQAEASKLVSEERTEDLTNMYQLLRPVRNALTPLVVSVQLHIKQQGLSAVDQLQGDNLSNSFVENLLAVHSKYTEQVASLYGRDNLFQEALHKAFENVVNVKMPKGRPSPEIIAKYCDTLLRKSTKGLSESEIDDKLNSCITIFKYVEDKDVFQKFYSRNLAKRLIHQQSVSMDAEELMINKLKAACGYEFTNKLHRMFTDIAISEGHNSKFAEYLKENNLTIQTNISISILQAGAWPMGTNSLIAMSLPQELERPIQYFEEFYHKSYNGRKLTWLQHLSQGELRCSFTSRTYLITLVSYHVAILLLFQTVDSMKVSELLSGTKMPVDNLYKFLLLLIDNKILTSTDKDLTSETTISLNLNYSNKRTKFKILGVSMKEQAQEEKQESTATQASVEEGRKLFIQASIVRIMKTRKIMRHTDLMQEVIAQSKGRFVPQVPLIKKCIELLLDKTYIERSAGSNDEYKYIA